MRIINSSIWNIFKCVNFEHFNKIIFVLIYYSRQKSIFSNFSGSINIWLFRTREVFWRVFFIFNSKVDKIIFIVKKVSRKSKRWKSFSYPFREKLLVRTVFIRMANPAYRQQIWFKKSKSSSVLNDSKLLYKVKVKCLII